MTLEEIKQSGAAEQRVKWMKVNVKSAKDSAKQLNVQADTNVELLKMRQLPEKLAELHR